MNHKAIVLDANILIRAILGKRVRELIAKNLATVKFFAPDVAYEDARKYLPTLLETRPTSARLAWRLLKGFVGWCNEQPAYAGLLIGNRHPGADHGPQTQCHR